ERPIHFGEGARVGAVLFESEAGHAAHPFEVGAGAEGVTLALQHDDSRRALDLACRGGHRADELRVERVLAFRPRNGDARDRALDRRADHARSNICTCQKIPRLDAASRSPASRAIATIAAGSWKNTRKGLRKVEIGRASCRERVLGSVAA